MPSKIEWLRGQDGKPGETWNPFGWGCYGPTGTAENPRPCSYCYAKRLADRKLRKCPQCQAFIPHWHPEELEKPFHWRKPKRIFVASMSDPFGKWVQRKELEWVLLSMLDARHHTYYLLTKQPEQIATKLPNWEWANWPSFFPNLWIGVSVTCTADLPRIAMLRDAWPGHKFVSFEPLYSMDTVPDLADIEWVIIGAQTGPVRQPIGTAVVSVETAAALYRVPVFEKDNLELTHLVKRQEWPR